MSATQSVLADIVYRRANRILVNFLALYGTHAQYMKPSGLIEHSERFMQPPLCKQTARVELQLVYEMNAHKLVGT